MNVSLGNAFIAIASLFPTLHAAILELVQNSVDAKARNISILINYRKRTCSVSDDGVGTTRERFEKCMKSICRSIKEQDEYGQYGEGAIAPIGKCDVFTFTSTPEENPRAYLCWTFNTEEIQQHSDKVAIPVKEVEDLCFDRSGKNKNGVPWRTKIMMTGLSRDRTKTRVNPVALRDAILDRYGVKMRELGTSIGLKIISHHGEEISDVFMAEEYKGRKLPVEYFKQKATGQVVFRLYLAQKTAAGFKGKVVVGALVKPFRLSFREFSRKVKEYLSPEVAKDLLSGIFEGEILGEKILIAQSREEFEMTDALVEFCIAIEEWHKKIGAALAREAKDAQEDDRYQGLILRSLKIFEQLFNSKGCGYLKEVINSFSRGTIGAHHAPPAKRIVGVQPHKSVSVQGDGKKFDQENGGLQPAVPEKENLGHMPFTAAGPRGKQRTIVKGSSLGLQLVYEDFGASEKVWSLDTREGILRLNRSHVLIHQCEADEKVLMRFQELIIIEALTLEMAPTEWREQQRRLSDEKLPAIVFLLLNGDEIAGRKPGSALKKYNLERVKKDPA